MSLIKQNPFIIIVLFTFVTNVQANLIINLGDNVQSTAMKPSLTTKLAASDHLTESESLKANIKTDAVQEARARSRARARAKARAKDKLDKESQIILFLKNGQSCGSWFDASGTTGDAGAYEQIKSSGYTKANAPESVKKQIALGVANCDKKYLLDKPAPMNDNKIDSDLEKPQLAETKERPLNEPKGIFGFFGKLFESIRNSGTSKHECSPGERAIHSSGC